MHVCFKKNVTISRHKHASHTCIHIIYTVCVYIYTCVCVIIYVFFNADPQAWSRTIYIRMHIIVYPFESKSSTNHIVQLLQLRRPSALVIKFDLFPGSDSWNSAFYNRPREMLRGTTLRHDPLLVLH